MNWDRDSLGTRIVRRVVAMLDRLRDYLLLTLRQIHNQLGAANVTGDRNTQGKYKEDRGRRR